MTAFDFQTLYGFLPDPMLLVSADESILSANAAAKTLFARQTTGLEGVPLHELVKDSPEQVSRLLSLVASSEQLVPGELVLKSGSHQGIGCRIQGARLPADQSDSLVLRLQPRSRSGTQVSAAVKKGSHVSERGAVAEPSELLTAIVETCDDAIIGKDLDGIIKTWNQGAERIFGYTAAETIGQPITILIPPDRLEEEPKILEQLRRGKRVDHFETIRRKKDGTLLNISLTISPVKNKKGQIIGASKVARDITVRKRFSELQERLAAIVESSDDAILSNDLNGMVQSWNRGAERIFGYTAEEMTGRHISIIAAPDRADGIPGLLDKIRRGERVDHYETKRRTKDGRVLTVSLTVSPLRDAGGAVIGGSEVARDVSERVQYEANLRRANAALLRANADLQHFVYSASHDLQEPLRMVTAYSDLLQQKFSGQLGETGEEYIRQTVQGALRMESLLRDLRAYVQASTSEEVAAEIDTDQVLNRVICNLELMMEESGAKIITSTPLPRVRMHEFQVEQLLQNLIGNAIRYRSSAPPRICVRAIRQQDAWLFSVGDNGIGIENKFKEQIFGMFQRLHSGSQYPGTGMGLAICRRIMERVGGQIWVDSEPGRGSTFYFSVPDNRKDGDA